MPTAINTLPKPMEVIPMGKNISLRMEVKESSIIMVDGKEMGESKFYIASIGDESTINAIVGDQVLFRPSPIDFTYGDKPISDRRIIVPEASIIAVLK